MQPQRPHDGTNLCCVAEPGEQVHGARAVLRHFRSRIAAYRQQVGPEQRAEMQLQDAPLRFVRKQRGLTRLFRSPTHSATRFFEDASPYVGDRELGIDERCARLAERHANAGYQLCDLTHCQLYRGRGDETPEARAAVAKTKGQLLYVGGVVLRLVEEFDRRTHIELGLHFAQVADDGGLAGLRGTDAAFRRTLAAPASLGAIVDPPGSTRFRAVSGAVRSSSPTTRRSCP